jgi:NADPH-dependent ferric siderophore reductase
MTDLQSTSASPQRRGAAMPEELSLRLTGDETGIGAVISALRAMPDVEGVVELGLDVPGQGDDASSLGLPSEEGKAEAQDVQIHISNSIAYDHVHGRIETLAAGAGVVVEWLDLEGE